MRIKSTEAILNVIKEKPQITLDAIASETGISKRTISREIKKIQEDGIIRRVGSARSGQWEII